MPRLGDPADLPEVFSHVANSRVNIVCKLQWQDSTFEKETKNVWLKSRCYLRFMHNYFLHLGMLHLLFRVTRFRLALNIS